MSLTPESLGKVFLTMGRLIWLHPIQASIYLDLVYRKHWLSIVM